MFVVYIFHNNIILYYYNTKHMFSVNQLLCLGQGTEAKLKEG